MLDDFNLGTTYTFKIKSRSAFDFSVNYSNEVAILAAMEPERPEPPVISVNGDNVLINWEAPFDRGSPITGYKV
jgi:hypothetical protein